MPLISLRAFGRCGYRALRRRTFSKSVSRDQGAVVFAGDSITEQWSTLSKDFPGLKTVNRGISGDTSGGLLLRFQQDVLSGRPSAVVILIGTNDLPANVPPRRIAACIRRMVEKTEKNCGIPVVVCHVLPRAREPGRFPETIRELNGLIDLLATSRKNVQVCDAFAPLADADGSVRKDCSADGLHLNAAGYGVLAEALRPFLPEPFSTM